VNDGIVDHRILENILKIKENMYPVVVSHENFERDLAKEIARIANEARQLGYKLRKENRDMTKEEAYKQLGHSASLLRAILEYLAGMMDEGIKKHVPRMDRDMKGEILQDRRR